MKSQTIDIMGSLALFIGELGSSLWVTIPLYAIGGCVALWVVGSILEALDIRI